MARMYFCKQEGLKNPIKLLIHAKLWRVSYLLFTARRYGVTSISRLRKKSYLILDPPVIVELSSEKKRNKN